MNLKRLNLKPDDMVYFFPYTTDTPRILKGRITDDWGGNLFIAYSTDKENLLADDGEWLICKEEDFNKSETKIKLFNLLQQIKEDKIA